MYGAFSWRSDEVMARQTLTGVSPLAISVCKFIPPHFRVTNDDVAKYLDNGTTLEQEMKVNKLC